MVRCLESPGNGGTDYTIRDGCGMKVHNSYSSVMFSPDRMRRVIKELTEQLPKLRADFNFDTIVVSGKSGAALGFALSMSTDINVVFVRKGESTHGDMIEGPNGHEFTRYAFFDDFISSGATRDRVHDELIRYSETRHEVAPQRVLTIEYQTGEDETGLPGWRQIRSACPSFAVANWSFLASNDCVLREAA